MPHLYQIGPLRVAKRQWKAPWSLDPFDQRREQPSNQSEFYDTEKRAASYSQRQLLNDSEYDSDLESERTGDDASGSSRATSNSGEPMLHKNKPFRAASAYNDPAPRRRFNRIFSVSVGALLIGFVITLVVLSSKSKYEVQRAAKLFGGVRETARVWQDFPLLERYYGGIRSLVDRASNVPEYPEESDEMATALENVELVPETSETQQRRKRSDADEDEDDATPPRPSHNLPPSEPFNPLSANIEVNTKLARRECFLDAEAKVKVPSLRSFPGVVKAFPSSVIGSADLLGLNNQVCFDRFGKLGPYGLGYSQKYGGTGAGMEGDTEGAEAVWSVDAQVDFRGVDWAAAQERCADVNRHRFDQDVGRAVNLGRQFSKRQVEVNSAEESEVQPILPAEELEEVVESKEADRPKEAEKPQRQGLPRQAVVIRTWADYRYDPEDIMYLRSLISELSLASGTEYFVHFLVHVKDHNLQIWSDKETYQRVLNESLPEEFRGLGTLWSEKQVELLYSGLAESNYRDRGVYGVYRSTFMPLSWFAQQHPEYDFFWNWEMDIRYTGHFYHLFDRAAAWAKEQPRKGLWERNSRFYVPQEHGSWEDFRQMVRVQTEHGTSSRNNLFAKLGSPAANLDTPQKTIEKPIWGPEPPQVDKVVTADDPKPPTTYDKDHYEWGVGEDADLITFNPIFDPDQTDWNLAEDVTGYDTSKGLPPRRVAVVAASRLSKRLLNTMHHETAMNRHSMFSEMWPASCALHHGLKAVYAPHPEYIDRKWPTDYLAAIYNGGRNGATGGSRNSVFNDARHHNLLGISWYYHAQFPLNLWKRWLGYKVEQEGGEEYELANEGRMCLPPMLLHPIKDVTLIYDHGK